MTVYVDDMRMLARVGKYTARWSHLTADTIAELNEFAERLGLKREWLQHEDSYRFHYDLVETKRKEAVVLGATAISYREFGKLISDRNPARRDASH